MGFNIDRVRHIQSNETTPKIGSEGTARSESNRAIYSKNPAEFTMTGSYKQYHAKLANLFTNYGLPASQAETLADLGKLQADHLIRIIIVAQHLARNQALTKQLTELVKRISTNGKNIQAGLKTFLDGLEDMLGIDSQSLIEQARRNDRKNTTQTNTPSTSETKAVNLQSEAHFYKDIQQHLSNAGLSDLSDDKFTELMALLNQIKQNQTNKASELTAEQTLKLQNFLQIASQSIEEFPDRFHHDLYGLAKLLQKGASSETYLKLVHDVSPARLINLLFMAEKSGHQSRSILDSLITVHNSGGSVLDAVKNLEYQYDPLMRLGPRHIAQGKLEREIIMEQGSARKLSFLAFDSEEGLITPEKSGFVLYPQNFHYTGNSMDLGFLPAGSYLFMLVGYNFKNQMIQHWIKIIVTERDKRKNQKSFDEFKQDLDRNNDEDSSHSNQNKPSPPPDSDGGVRISFEHQPPQFNGQFLGEVVLPFDLMNHNADDLLILSPKTGIVLSPEEFYEGNFFNNAVAFRFLTPQIKSPDITKRHAMLNLNPSRAFEAYNKGLRNFVLNPGLQLEDWKKTLTDFFENLRSLFPDGKETFAIAERFFTEQSEAFAQGTLSGEIYENTTLEKNQDRFLSAFFSKGAYALARAGDVSGAIHGMSFASLIDLNNPYPHTVLGNYLDEVRKNYYTHESNIENTSLYDTHIRHHLGKRLQITPYFQDLGRQFIKAVQLSLPQSTTEPPQNRNSSYGYGLYR